MHLARPCQPGRCTKSSVHRAPDVIARATVTRCGHFALPIEDLLGRRNGKGTCSEPETAQTPLGDVPMGKGKVGGSRPADSDRLLLLHELPRSRTSVRAAGFCAARARSRQWNSLDPISKGSSAMHDGAAVS